jgi:tetratricopeptide (TPR) repeat protein
MAGLTDLLESSLIQRIHGPDASRLTMLETIREYTASLLENREHTLLAGRHLGWAIRLAEQADPGLIGPDQGLWLSTLTAENDNLRAALTHAAMIRDAARAQRLAGALWRYWEITGRVGEGRGWLDRTLALGDDTPAEIRAAVLKGAGNLARDQGDQAAARYHYAAALHLFRTLDDPAGVASTECNLGNLALDVGDISEATRRYQTSLAGAHTTNNRTLAALVLNNLALAQRRDGDPRYAITMVQQSLTLWQEIGNQREIGRAMDTLGRIHCVRGEFTTALGWFRQSLPLRHQIGDRAGTARSLEGLARAMVGLGRYPAAARLLGHAEKLRELIGEPLTLDDRFEYEPVVQALTDVLPARHLQAEYKAGAALNVSDLITDIETK